MAGGDNTGVKSAVELEFMSKEDSSWHPCQVSLRPSGGGLAVYYGSDGLEDTFVSEEETLARLRVRSNPLQGDDCTHIKQGEHVLAAEKSNSSFFDAEVEKVLKVRHSKKVHCRCTFVVKWLQRDPKDGTLVVPSSAIMKLAKESINGHPTISSFFHAVRTMSPLPTIGIDMDSELDLHELLGKQIEEINHSADASQKGIKEDILLGFKGSREYSVETSDNLGFPDLVHTKGQIQHRPVTPDQNHLRRSTRKSIKQQAETEIKDPATLVPATQEELPENKSPVNPLAARAALASLMSKLPKNLEFSLYQEGEKLFSNSSDITSHKQAGLESLYATEDISAVTNSFSLTATFSSETEVAEVVPKRDSIVKSLFSTKSDLGITQPLDVSFTRWTKDCEKGKKISEVTDSSENFTHSIARKNISHPRKATTLTRAVVQNVADTLVDNTGNKQMPATQSRRLTRSAVHKEEKIKTTGTEEAIIENISNCDATDTPDQNVISRESYALKEKYEGAIRSSLDTETDSASKAPKSLMTVGGRNKKNDIESTNSVFEINNLCNTGRLTRAAIHKNIANTTVDNSQGLVENKFSKDTDSSGGNVGPLSTAFSVHPEISLLPSEERNKKRKTSGAFKATQETEGIVFSDDGNSQDRKRKSTGSQKHEVRSSPRLRFLPRTRSQRKN